MFFKFYKKLTLLIVAYALIETNCSACKHHKLAEEQVESRMLRRLSGLFTCLFGNCIGYSPQYEFKKIQNCGESYEVEELGEIENISIKMLPNETLYHVATYLSPPDINRLLKSNKRFLCLRSNDFWLYYNNQKGHIVWDQRLTADKVAFSYYWFTNNNIRKAVSMGFPEALKCIKQQEKSERERSQKVSAFSYNEIKPSYDYFILKKFYYGRY